MPPKSPRFLCRSRTRRSIAPQSRLECSFSRRRTLDAPEDLTHRTTAQTGFYTHRGLDEQASSIRPGALTPATPPRSCPREHGWMAPRGRHRKMRNVSLERLYSTYSWPGSEFDAYLRYFREGSPREQLDLTRLSALFVRPNGPCRSGASPARLRRGGTAGTFSG
jgi:hypothetical protein